MSSTPIVSAIPGRIRLRHHDLKHTARLQDLYAHIRAFPTVQSISSNPATGSLLIHYDANAVSLAAFSDQCRNAVDALWPKETVLPAAKPPGRIDHPHSRSSMRTANRMAKHAMFASLGASLLLAAMGRKQWHIWTGLVFMHALGVHLWVHRRNLLR